MAQNVHFSREPRSKAYTKVSFVRTVEPHGAAREQGSKVASHPLNTIEDQGSRWPAVVWVLTLPNREGYCRRPARTIERETQKGEREVSMANPHGGVALLGILDG